MGVGKGSLTRTHKNAHLCRSRAKHPLAHAIKVLPLARGNWSVPLDTSWFLIHTIKNDRIDVSLRHVLFFEEEQYTLGNARIV